MTVIPFSSIHIRQAAALEKSCFSVPWSFEAIREEFADGLSRFFAAVENGVLLGYIACKNIAGEGEIFRLAVMQAERRRGIGRALLSAYIEACNNEDVTRLMLEVRESNSAAIELYLSAGFTVTGRRADYYDCPREDAVLMDMILNTEKRENTSC